MKKFFSTVSTEISTQPNVGRMDVIARIRQTSSNIVSVHMVETQDFISQIIQIKSNWKQDVDTLNDVINWQHKIIDFNSSYAAYLLEQISEEEFEQVAEIIASDELDIEPDLLALMISRTLQLTTIEFSPSDLANLFNCSVDTVDDALNLIPTMLMDNQPQLQEAAK